MLSPYVEVCIIEDAEKLFFFGKVWNLDCGGVQWCYFFSCSHFISRCPPSPVQPLHSYILLPSSHKTLWVQGWRPLALIGGSFNWKREKWKCINRRDNEVFVYYSIQTLAACSHLRSNFNMCLLLASPKLPWVNSSPYILIIPSDAQTRLCS